MKPGDKFSIPGMVTLIRPIARDGEAIAGQTIVSNLRGNLWLAAREWDGLAKELIVCTDGVPCTDGFKPGAQISKIPSSLCNASDTDTPPTGMPKEWLWLYRNNELLTRELDALSIALQAANLKIAALITDLNNRGPG